MFFGCLPCCGGEQICPRGSDWPGIRSDIEAGVAVSAQAFFSYKSEQFNKTTGELLNTFEQHATFAFNQTISKVGLYQRASIVDNQTLFTVSVDSSQNSVLGNYVRLTGQLGGTSNGFGFSIGLGPCSVSRAAPYTGKILLRFYHNTTPGTAKHSPGASSRFSRPGLSDSLPANPLTGAVNSPLFVGNPVPAVLATSGYNDETTKMLPAWGGFLMLNNTYTPSIQPNLTYKDQKAAAILFESAVIEADDSDFFFGHFNTNFISTPSFYTFEGIFP
jgi:hypothetical protein